MRTFLIPRCLVLLAALLALVVASNPTPAFGHALLVRADPAVNARLLDGPDRVTASFTEPLDGSLTYLRVLNGEGQRVDSDDMIISPSDDREMSVGLGANLTPGFYTVAWQTLSTQDGHLLKGSYPFTLLNPDGSEPSGPRFAETGSSFSGGGPTADTSITKWNVYVLAVLLTGSLAFSVIVVSPSRRQRTSKARASTNRMGRDLYKLTVASLVLLAIAGALELVAQARALGGFNQLDTVLGTFWGERWLQRQALLAAIAAPAGLSILADKRGRLRLAMTAAWVALSGSLGYLLLLSTVSHAASVPGSFWAVLADFVHLAATAIWLGMLGPLALLFLTARRRLEAPDRDEVLAAYLQRFSAAAASALVLLLATGTFNAFVQVSSLQGMIDTAYGRVLAAKLALIIPLLGVTSYNALRLRPALRSGQSGADAGRLLRRLIPLELGLGLGVLAIVAILVYYPTPRQQSASKEFTQASAGAVVGFDQTVAAGDLSVNISVAPNTVGTNTYQVYIFPPASQEPPKILRVRLRFQAPTADAGPSEIVAEPAAPNFYKAVGPFFTAPGSWEVNVDVRRQDAEDLTAVFKVPVAGAQGQTASSKYDLPLVTGSWLTVGAFGILVFGLVLWAGVSQWPGLPRPANRPIRIIRVASTVVGLGLVVGTIFGILEVSERTSGRNPVPATAGSIASGRGLFMQNCIVCHGATGRGDGPQAASLPVPPADFSVHIPYHADSFFFEVITRGLGGVMPAFGDRLTEKQRWDLVNWLKSEFGLQAQSAGTSR